MEKASTHIIHRLNLDVDVPDMDTAMRIYDHVLDLLYADVLPQLEAVLQQRGKEQVYWNAQAIDIVLEFESEAEFNNRFASRSATALDGLIVDSVKDVVPPAKEVVMPAEKIICLEEVLAKRRNIFLFFLQTGRLPWHAAASAKWLDEAALLEEVGIETGVWKNSFLAVVNGNNEALVRLTKQFTPDFLFRFCTLLFGVDAGVMPQGWMQFTHKSSQIDKARQQQWLLQWINGLMQEKAYPEHAAVAVLPDNGVAPKESTADNKAIANREEAIDGGLFVQHAGLALLHPFLLYFFKELELLDGDQFIGDWEKQSAIHLLYFLATGKEQPFAYELLMEQRLCAWPEGKPLERFLYLTDKMKEESVQLLQAVIQHWKVLKNTSPDALRESFLQRNGKIIPGDVQDRLMVESSSIDILLEYLPWNYTLFSLPWSKKILHVDWVINR